MYFVVIMAFAFVLSDNLPPAQFNLFPGPRVTAGTPLAGALACVLAYIVLVGIVARLTAARAIARLGTSVHSHDDAVDTYTHWQRVLLGGLAGGLAFLMACTPWPALARVCVALPVADSQTARHAELLGDFLALAPFLTALIVAWVMLYRAETQIRRVADAHDALSEPAPTRNDAASAALRAARRSSRDPTHTLGQFLVDKFRHHVLIIAAPMTLIVIAKHFTDLYRGKLFALTRLPWASDAVLGATSIMVLAVAPLMLRYAWATEPLPAGALRDRFASLCRRIGLRYRNILLWHTHGTAVNAAVMGFVGPMRYILVSDALLAHMDEDEIEAVFGHEAGHVQHWHLHFFGMFALVSMYIAGGLILLLWQIPLVRQYDPDGSLVELTGLAILLVTWLFGFGWVSRRFERQADLYGVRCLAPDLARADADQGPDSVAAVNDVGISVKAANLFGRTLARIADLNGIPRDAPSWRHGSIESRYRLLEKFAYDAEAVRRFDRDIRRIKIGLFVAALIGTVGAGLVYYNDIARALRLPL